MNDQLLDGRDIPWDLISGPKPPSPVSAHRITEPVTFRPDPVASAATEANLRVLQRALETSSKVVANLFSRNGNESDAA